VTDTREISVEELHRRAENGDRPFLLDVRTDPEFIAGRLSFTDALIPYDALPFYLEQLPEDKDTPIACFCRSGNRSRYATEFLRSLGYRRAVNVRGGIIAWKNAGYEITAGPVSS